MVEENQRETAGEIGGLPVSNSSLKFLPLARRPRDRHLCYSEARGKLRYSCSAARNATRHCWIATTTARSYSELDSSKCTWDKTRNRQNTPRRLSSHARRWGARTAGMSGNPAEAEGMAAAGQASTSRLRRRYTPRCRAVRQGEASGSVCCNFRTAQDRRDRSGFALHRRTDAPCAVRICHI